jgi:hypothetical protein|tara:strand:+ start:6585 stop:6839 length:255 start_codon:yes stop_codon:yes gene_type:complete
MVKKIIDGVEYELSDEEIAALKTEEESMKPTMAREQRNILLSESDVYALADRITDEWRTYRQALRDVPLQAGFPDDITWPTKPV